MITTTDNNCGKCDCPSEHKDNLLLISYVKISEIKIEDCPKLLVFPRDFTEIKDKIQDECVLRLKENDTKIETGNIMGFIGVNDTKISITSRFAHGSNDYFLHYLLEKVFSINLFDLKYNTDSESIFDFLFYLFPGFLKKALRQGIYREYTKKEYNDANVRGCIDVNRHIRRNIPFAGKIAYNTREYCYDNAVNQLVRHTIEYIRQHKFGGNILNSDNDMRDAVAKIEMATPTYIRNKRQAIINKNIRPVRHPYFMDYIQLQRLCLRILRHEELKYGSNNDEIYGILFDGAWLWEEYMNTILKDCGFTHPENKNGTNGIQIFMGKINKKCYPDFYRRKDDESIDLILDAKYKHLENSIAVDDIHQIISYMYIEKARQGGFIFPIPIENLEKEEYKGNKNYGALRGYGGEIFTYGFAIPEEKTDFNRFRDEMKTQEEKLKEIVVQDFITNLAAI